MYILLFEAQTKKSVKQSYPPPHGNVLKISLISFWDYD
jgi:hypothetical protein